MKAAGPEATLAYLRTTELIDIEHPEQSLLLRSHSVKSSMAVAKRCFPAARVTRRIERSSKITLEY